MWRKPSWCWCWSISYHFAGERLICRGLNGPWDDDTGHESTLFFAAIKLVSSEIISTVSYLQAVFFYGTCRPIVSSTLHAPTLEMRWRRRRRESREHTDRVIINTHTHTRWSFRLDLMSSFSSWQHIFWELGPQREKKKKLSSVTKYTHTHTHRRDKEGSSALLPQTANRLTSLASHTQLQKKEKGFIIIIFHHRKHGRLCGEAGDYFLYATGDYLCTCCLLLNSIITTSCVRFLVFKLLFLFCFLLEFLKKGKKIVF